QEDFKRAAAAIAQRSDADIAEAMSTVVLKEYQAFCKEVFEAVGTAAGLKHADAFTYILSASAYAFRAFLLPELGAGRMDRVQERLALYAFAGLIHGVVRNPKEPPRDSAPLDRGKLLASLCEAFPKAAEIHQQNFWKLDGEQQIATYCM